MKKIASLLLICILFNCNDDAKKAQDTTVEAQTEQKEIEVTKQEDTKIANATNDIPFLADIKALEQDTSANPIETFKTIATTQANKSITLTKANIESALEMAKNYKHTVIVVGKHTIVKVTDLTNCKVSASWGACMPYAEGYVKKGNLKPQADYANNIIGLPDAQERVMYLFN